MRIMVLYPGEGSILRERLGEELRARREYLMQFASPGTDIEVFQTKGAKAMLRGRDIAMIVPSAVETAIQGEEDGFDAIIIHAI
jgi:Asp/Glu/hydantoin racemase